MNAVQNLKKGGDAIVAATRNRLRRSAASVATGALLLVALAPAYAQSGQQGQTQQPSAAQPFVAVTYTPAQPVAGQSFRTSWRSGNNDQVSFSCTAPGTGYNYANDVGTGAGYFDQVAQPGWVGNDATCVWTADNGELSTSVTTTLVTVAAPSTPAPTISVTRNPNPMTAGASYTLSWRTTDTGSISRVCTASAGGFTANDAPTATGGSESGTASASWVDKPSNCTWTASGPGGSTAVTETMTTQAAATTPTPTLSVSRTPNPMTAGASYTLSWSANGATSISRVCTSSGGYTVNDAPTATGGSTNGTASAGWVGHPSSCTWTATGAGGNKVVTETMTTQAAVDDGITYIHTDSLGSPVARSNSRGEIISRTRYEPYGLTAAGATPTIGFTGHVNDTDTGLVYMQQRYYDPIAGRMLSIDPVTTDANTGSSFNRYAYAENNPYKYVDPDGRDTDLACFNKERNDALNATIGPAHFDQGWHGEISRSVNEALQMAPGAGGVGILKEFVGIAAKEAPVVAKEATLLSRVDAIHGALDPIAAGRRTTAALDTVEGARILAAGGRDLSPAQRALMAPGEVASKLPRAHAEVTLLNHAKQNGLSPASMAVSRTICPACKAAIEESGGQLTSPTTAAWPR